MVRFHQVLIVSLIMAHASFNSSSVMTRGGASRRMWSCVGLQSNPFSLSLWATFHAFTSEYNRTKPYNRTQPYDN